MAQKNRSKEVWLVPKRVNLHQTICLIDGLVERKYSGTTWNGQKQNNLGVNLKKWGATNNGKNISPQSIRTLVASIPQYLGFIYINTDTTPNTICITPVGMQLWENHKSDLVKVSNLRDGKEYLITESEILLKQMEKLQITNPIILKDCENILVFPFRMTLRLLLELDYLDREELAYIVFKLKDETEYNLAIQEIKNFRKQDYIDRVSIINTFKQTHIGNITLVDAPSAGYYEALCLATGIIQKDNIVIPNPNNVDNNKLTAISIKSDYVEYVKEILNQKYQDIEAYDFKQNLKLWIEYIGNPNRISPPKDISIKNATHCDLLICVKKDNEMLDGDLIEVDKELVYPMFMDEAYVVECMDIETGNILNTQTIVPNHENINFEIITANDKSMKKENLEDICNELIEHSNAKKFSSKMINYLNLLYKIDGKVREDDKYLRGAYYEFLFYKILSILEAEQVIDEVIWNGKIGKYGLPIQAPGGVNGTPDMVFKIDNEDFVLELTTIRPKSTQFKAEGSSVPGHINLYKKGHPNSVTGVFCAPQMHERNIVAMKAAITEEDVYLKCITDMELIEIFKLRNREVLLTQLKS